MGAVKYHISDEAIDAAIARSAEFDSYPRIVKAAYNSAPEMQCLLLVLNDGRRLFIPKEDLSELKDATPEQASDLFIMHNDRGIWWPQIDDGLYLPDFLERRWHGNAEKVAA